jgi:hypothetical protein
MDRKSLLINPSFYSGILNFYKSYDFLLNKSLHGFIKKTGLIYRFTMHFYSPFKKLLQMVIYSFAIDVKTENLLISKVVSKRVQEVFFGGVLPFFSCVWQLVIDSYLLRLLFI